MSMVPVRRPLPVSSLRAFLALLMLSILLIPWAGARADPITVTDIRGRTVTLPHPARRVAIDDSRFLIAMALIDPDPVARLAAWPKDTARIGPRIYDQYRHRFPALDTVPLVSSSQDPFQLEPLIAAAPDVALFTAGHLGGGASGPTDEQVAQLQAAGIAVVFLDFAIHPFEDLSRSMRILGRLLGREAAADAFADFRDAHLRTIAERLKSATGEGAPSVLFEAHAGMTDGCCLSPGRAGIGEYIRFAGGRNIGADVLPGAAGRLNLEYVIERNPDVYIATGGPHLEKVGGLVLGPGYDAATARAALARMAARPGLAQVQAVRDGRVYGVAHQLFNSPLDLIAIEALARWLHPALFADLDPEKTLETFNQRFLPVPLEGTQWVALPP